MAEAKVVRKQLYSGKGTLHVGTLGTEEWTKLPRSKGSSDTSSFQNVMWPTINPGTISAIQRTERSSILDGHLASPIYISKATFNFAELYDIRLKEYDFGLLKDVKPHKIRIEILVGCKSPPVGQGLVKAVGV